MSRISLLVTLLLATGVVQAEVAPEAERAPAPTEAAAQTVVDAKAEPDARKEDGEKVVSGMSILGNLDAPKALVIVPWKSSELGASLGISPMLDDSKQPVDKEVFMRALSYYEIRSEKTP